MRSQIGVVAAALLSFCFVAVSKPYHVIHEKRDSYLNEWIKRSRAEPREYIPMRIALREQNLEHAEKYIMDISSPYSPNFGKHWSAEKVANTFRPSEETSYIVVQWLIDSGIAENRISLSTGHNWLQFDATINEAESLLQTEYHLFENLESGDRHMACDHYSVPYHVREHIDFIMPTIQLGGLQRLGKNLILPGGAPKEFLTEIESNSAPMSGLTGLTNCSNILTIECLRAIYDFPVGTSNQSSNMLGIGEWDDYLYQPDLQKFFHVLTKPTIPSDTFPEFVSIDGGKHADIPVIQRNYTAVSIVESAIDFQLAYSILYPKNLRLYQVGDGVNVNSVGTFNIFLDALDASYCTYEGGDSPTQDPHYPDPKPGGYKGPLQCGGAPKSNVLSLSYGQEEAMLTPSYQVRQCNEWMKLGLQGVSVLFASGDSGVANRYNAGFPNKCLLTNSNDRSIDGTRFSPSFPVNCPYITVVGGTELLGNSIYGGEKAVSYVDPKHPDMAFHSGGGFSNIFEVPQYQSDAVSHYLKTYPPPYSGQQYNNSGKARGYPDVSALSIQLAIAIFNMTGPYGGGTSASTPIVASLVTMLNEERLNQGKSPIGFLNPTFYAHPEAFNDVTVGSNPGCGTSGFAAQPGWDPVTGLGTPNYAKLREVFLNLPITNTTHPPLPSATASSSSSGSSGSPSLRETCTGIMYLSFLVASIVCLVTLA